MTESPENTIESSIAKASAILGGRKNLDTETYRQAAQNALNSGQSLSSLNPHQFKKKENTPPPGFSLPGLSFNFNFENGKFTGVGSNGEKIQSADLYELNSKIAETFKTDALKKGRTPECWFKANPNIPVDINTQKQNFAKAFINAGVIPHGDIPQDPKFWQNFKNEYLNNPKNTPEQWEKLTNHIPDKVIGRNRAAQSMAKHMMMLRMGSNPKLTPPVPFRPRQMTRPANPGLLKMRISQNQGGR